MRRLTILSLLRHVLQMAAALLKEDGGAILLETGDRLMLEARY